MSSTQEKAEYLMLGCNAMGWHGSANFVKELLEQRAELLEALKMLFEDADSTCEAYDIAKAAINRAEAAE